jgi:hypothetical protein
MLAGEGAAENDNTKIAVKATSNSADIGKAIDEADGNNRKAFPTARIIYLEPNVLRSSKN